MAETSVFTTERLPQPHRFSAWRESVGVIFDVETDAARLDGGFDARVESVLLDGLVLNKVRSGAQAFRRDVPRFAADGLDHYMIQLFTRGGVAMKRGRTDVQAKAGALVGFDLAETLDSVNDDFELISLFIPRRRMAPLLSSPDSLHGRMADTSTGTGRLIADYLGSLHANAPAMGARDAAVASDALIRLCAMALDGDAGRAGDPPGWADHAVVLKARQVMASRASDPDLTPADIAAETGVSRTRLYEAFREVGGVAETLRELRLRRCFSDLVTARGAGLQVAEIGYRWGFSDPAVFSRAFKERFGASPNELRAHPARIHPARPRAPGLDPAYEHWIAALA